MVTDHVVSCLTFAGAWMSGIGVGYVCAVRDGRAWSDRCRGIHDRMLGRIRWLEQALARAQRPHLATTLTGDSTYEEIVRSSR